jgi:lipoyl(octanoyl) transferase
MDMDVPGRAPLEVYLLGVVEVEDVLALQRRLVYEYGERAGAALVLCEHPPTITIGRAGSRAHVLAGDDELRRWGVRTLWVNRGGGCVLHLPGQLSGYLVMPLEGSGVSVAGFVAGLRRSLVAVMEEFDLGGQVGQDGQGVLLGGERVATVGVAVRRWVAYHGFVLNVGPFLAPFGLLDAAAAGGVGRFTSMESRRQRPTSPSRVREAVIRAVEAEFGFEQHRLFTSHPLIPRASSDHVHVPCRA